MIIPTPLKNGDIIAILTPSTVVRKQYVTGACEYLARRGLATRIMPNIRYGEDGSIAGSIESRAEDLNLAIADPEIRAIWCARGGYGAVELLEHINHTALKAHPKWLLGFSDISALHALWHHMGIASIHSTMLRRLAAPEADSNPCVTEVIKLLTETDPRIHYTFASHPFNCPGSAEGMLIGGNLAVLSDLAGTSYAIFSQALTENVILFFEDVAESISRLQRRLWRLYLTGILHKAQALIFGQFTAYQPNADYITMEDMIISRIRHWGVKCPIVFDFPTGHVPDRNYPLVEGQSVCLTINKDSFSLSTV